MTPFLISPQSVLKKVVSQDIETQGGAIKRLRKQILTFTKKEQIMNDTAQQYSEIDTYQAGEELDALIAKEVFGIKGIKYTPTWGWGYLEGEPKTFTRLPRYSTVDADALNIVRHLCQDGRKPNELYFELVYGWWYQKDREVKGYPLVRAVFDWKETGDSHPLYQGLGDTIALAICRAALRVVREDLSLPEVVK